MNRETSFIYLFIPRHSVTSSYTVKSLFLKHGHTILYDKTSILKAQQETDRALFQVIGIAEGKLIVQERQHTSQPATSSPPTPWKGVS